MEKMKKIATSVMLVGVVIFAIGMYFAFVKAGIPYQDPTVEMQIQYMVDMKVGDILSVTGLLMIIVATGIRLLIGI